MKPLDIFAPREQSITVAEKKAAGIGLSCNRVAESYAQFVAFSFPAVLNGGLAGELRLAGSRMRFPVDQSCQAAAPNWSSLRRFPNRTAWSHIVKSILLCLVLSGCSQSESRQTVIPLLLLAALVGIGVLSRRKALRDLRDMTDAELQEEIDDRMTHFESFDDCKVEQRRRAAERTKP